MTKPVKVSLLLIILPELELGVFVNQEEMELNVREKKTRDGTCGWNLSLPSGPPPRAKPSLVLLRKPQDIVILFFALTNCQKLVVFHSSQDAQAQFLAACT